MPLFRSLNFIKRIVNNLFFQKAAGFVNEENLITVKQQREN